MRRGVPKWAGSEMAGIAGAGGGGGVAVVAVYLPPWLLLRPPFESVTCRRIELLKTEVGEVPRTWVAPEGAGHRWKGAWFDLPGRLYAWRR